MKRWIAVLAAVLMLPALAHAQALDGRLKKIRDAKSVAIAYRTDALPFSFVENNAPVGYTVDICKRIVASLEEQLKTPLQIKWVPATSGNRMDLVKNGQADMECGSTTATFSRMENVDFSSAVFVDTTGLLAAKSVGATSLTGLAGKKIAVIGGTTNQSALERSLKRRMVSANVMQYKTRDEAIAALDAGQVDAFAGDKTLLSGLAGKVKDPSLFEILADDLGFEPYAIVLPRGDAAFRLAVNRAIGKVFSSEAIVEIFRRTFGPNVQPTPVLLVVYGMGALPD